MCGSTCVEHLVAYLNAATFKGREAVVCLSFMITKMYKLTMNNPNCFGYLLGSANNLSYVISPNYSV